MIRSMGRRRSDYVSRLSIPGRHRGADRDLLWLDKRILDLAAIARHELAAQGRNPLPELHAIALRFAARLSKNPATIKRRWRRYVRVPEGSAHAGGVRGLPPTGAMYFGGLPHIEIVRRFFPNDARAYQDIVRYFQRQK